MKKNLLIALGLLFGSVTAQAQLTLRLVNNTNCAIQYMLILDNFDGAPCADGQSNFYVVAPGGQAVHTATSVSWNSGTPGSASGFSGFKAYNFFGSCAQANWVGESCNAGFSTTSVVGACPGACNAFTLNWTNYPGAGYVVTINP